MPRLLPRLVEQLTRKPLSPQFEAFEPFVIRSKSLNKPVPPRPSFVPSDYTKSVLLTPANPITESRLHVRHKTLPPYLRGQRRVRGRYARTEDDKPREMTAEERGWWANPYLRMLSSPVRRCVMTEIYLPNDFLIRLAPMRLTSPRVRGKMSFHMIIMPDGLEHSKYRVRRSGKAVYILCWKDAVRQLDIRKSGKRWVGVAGLHSLFEKQIRHLLCLRVLQELELLTRHVRKTRTSSDALIIRKLTRQEFLEVKQTNVIPYDDAVAILVVPPINRNPLTGQRPEASMSALPSEAQDSVTPRRPLLPSSKLHFASIEDSQHLPPDIPQLSRLQIPLYHGASLFPDPGQRMALHQLLSGLLNIERKIKWQSSSPSSHPNEDRASHAYLLHSSAAVAARADVVPLAIALWRLHMFDGGSWGENTGWWTTRIRHDE